MTKPQAATERRAQILDAAIACFARKGYHETRMDDIVAEAGLSKGSLYWHFDSKRELFRSLMDRYFSEFVSSLSAVNTAGMSARGRLESMMNVGAESAAEQHVLVRAALEFYGMALRDEELREWIRGLYEANVALMSDLIRQGIAEGDFRDGDPEAVARLALAYLDGAYLHNELYDAHPSADTLRRLTTPLLQLLLAKPEGHRA